MGEAIAAGGAGALMVVVLCFMCLPGILGAWMAKARGRGIFVWFVLCMFLPIIAHIAILALPKVSRWTCPACEGPLPSGSVIRCMHCGHAFKANMPKEEPEPEPAPAPEASQPVVDKEETEAEVVPAS